MKKGMALIECASAKSVTLLNRNIKILIYEVQPPPTLVEYYYLTRGKITTVSYFILFNF